MKNMYAKVGGIVRNVDGSKVSNMLYGIRKITTDKGGGVLICETILDNGLLNNGLQPRHCGPARAGTAAAGTAVAGEPAILLTRVRRHILFHTNTHRRRLGGDRPRHGSS